jgi:hypothetical protein
MRHNIIIQHHSNHLVELMVGTLVALVPVSSTTGTLVTVYATHV